MTRGLRLAEQYNQAKNFKKPTVISARWNEVTHLWVTLGKGHLILGCPHATFEEAIKEAIDGHRS